MMRSAGGIDKVTVSSIANIMSARDGLHVRFMKGHRAEGSHDVLKSGERLILLNPEKTEGKYWRRDILFHELWHDLSRDGGTKVLTEEIYRRSLSAFQHMVVDRYTKYYNGVSMSQFLDGKKWTEENVKAYFDTYTKISYDEVMEEVAAGTAGRVMGSKNFIKNFRDVSMLRRVFYGISDFCRAMVNKTYMTNGEETAGFMLSFKEALTFRRLYELAYTKERFHLDEGVLRAMEEIFMERDEGDSERARTKKSLSLDGVITAEMSDTERTAILNKKSIVAPIYEGQADAAISREESALKHYKIGIVKAALEKLAEEFGVINQTINIEDVNVRVTLSKRNIGESLSKEADPVQMAKLLPVLKDAVENSVGIERHDNRYYFDTDTVYFENLLGGFVDGDSLVPVRFGLKHSVTGKATLYVVVDQNAISRKEIEENKKTEVLTTTAPLKADSSAARSVIYSISQIIPFVNSKDVLRYIPDDMLSEEQRKTKWKGIAETVEKTSEKNDNKYAKYLSAGNIYAARQMIIAAAKANGYTIKVYHGSNAEFTVFDITKSRSWDGTPDYDLPGFYFSESTDESGGYGDTVKEYYIKIEKPYEGSLYRLAKEKGSYRKAYEYLIAEGYDGYIDTEMGEGFTEYIVLKPENIKSTDVITYDDQDRIVPISKRFDNSNPDTRYSLSLDADIPPLSAAEVEENANRVSWGFSWTDDKLLSNIRKVQKYFRERYPDHMVEFELNNKKKRIVIVAIRPMREARMSKGFAVPLAENDAYHGELTALFRSIGISDDRISEHISVFETEEEKNETIERAKKNNEGRRLKVYHKQEVAKSIEGVLSNVLSPIVGPSKLMGKKKRALITRLWQELNRAKASEREKLAERFAEELIVSTVYDDYEVNAEYEQMLVDGTVESYEMLNEYRKKLDVSAVIEDAKGSIGVEKVNVLRKRWGAGKDGISPRQAFDELQAQGFLVDLETANNEADILIALNEEYERLKERTSMRRELLPLAAMSEERLSSIKNELKTSLLAFFTEGGKDTKYGKLARRYQEQGKYYIET
ncbi:MAG: hypothetical protein IKC63_04785 [Clostridia bacterium]|nr:hypothetical protein [Clostridia bacterium]